MVLKKQVVLHFDWKAFFVGIVVRETQVEEEVPNLVVVVVGKIEVFRMCGEDLKEGHFGRV